jgi:hypothetical protein
MDTCTKGLFALCAVLILFIIYSYNKGTFGDMNSIYQSYQGCTYDNRNYPEGKIPGSKLGLNESEKRNIQLANFVQNSSVYKESEL